MAAKACWLGRKVTTSIVSGRSIGLSAIAGPIADQRHVKNTLWSDDPQVTRSGAQRSLVALAQDRNRASRVESPIEAVCAWVPFAALVGTDRIDDEASNGGSP